MKVRFSRWKKYHKEVAITSLDCFLIWLGDNGVYLQAHMLINPLIPERQWINWDSNAAS